MDESDRSHNRLKVLRIGIDTYQESVIYMRDDCHICRSEGFGAQTRIRIQAHNHSIIGRLNVIDADSGILPAGHLGLSKVAWQRLEVSAGDEVTISHPAWVNSLRYVRRKIFGHPLNGRQLRAIIDDILVGRYTDIHIASFLTACANRLDIDEIVELTSAMVEAGVRLEWPYSAVVVDKHCIGGLPGNRTTPIVVAIVAAAGLTMPKTSSRSITSPSGTADTMEVITRVDLDLASIRRVVRQNGACLVWGGNVSLSPVDDILIWVEKAMDLDSEGQLVASVLSKKIAAGSTHILIDIPVGPTAKVRTSADAQRLKDTFDQVGRRLGVVVQPIITDGRQPVGRGVGPAFEAEDVLAVLRNQKGAPEDLRSRAILLAGHILDMVSQAVAGTGMNRAERLLESGAAWAKFKVICEAQGGFKPIPVAQCQCVFNAPRDGVIRSIDNRKLSQAAKLAGAPHAKAAGIRLYVKVGQTVMKGDCLFELCAETPGELKYAQAYLEQVSDMIKIHADGAQHTHAGQHCQ